MYRIVQDGQSGISRGGTNNLKKPESRPYIRYVGKRKYNVKAFPAEQSQKSVNEAVPPETNDDFVNNDCKKSYSDFESLNHSGLIERGHGTPCPYCPSCNHSEEVEDRAYRRVSSHASSPRPQLENAWYQDIMVKPKKSSWWKRYMPKALVVFFVVAVLFLLFRPVSSSAEDNGPLSLNLPQILSKMLPQLNLFVQATGDDMLKIGQSYINNKGTITQSSDPSQSLDGLIAGMKDLSKEMGDSNSGNPVWDQVQNSFKNIRQEAWSVATQSGK